MLLEPPIYNMMLLKLETGNSSPGRSANLFIHLRPLPKRTVCWYLFLKIKKCRNITHRDWRSNKKKTFLFDSQLAQHTTPTPQRYISNPRRWNLESPNVECHTNSRDQRKSGLGTETGFKGSFSKKMQGDYGYSTQLWGFGQLLNN